MALAEDELEAAVQVFYVRRGRVVGRKGFIVDKVEDLDQPQFLADVLQQHYADAINGVPPLVLLPGEADEPEVIEEWLSGLRSVGPGGNTARDGIDNSLEWWAASGQRRPERSVNPRTAG